jgi:Mg-chelatase subunit ChlD
MTDSAYEVWLLDVSGSMGGARIKLLREAVRKLRVDAPHVRLVGFGTTVVPIASMEELDAITPNGGTNLHLALDHAAELMCGKVIVFTDGEPADDEACFAAAGKIPGVVDTIFCGDEDDKDARRFCDRLARDNGGRFVAKDIMKGETLLCSEVRGLLGLPAPTAL